MKNLNETTRTETFKVYTIIDKEGAQGDRWHLIGAAIDDKVSGGIKVTLNALPLNGRIHIKSNSTAEKVEQKQQRVMKESITLKDIHPVSGDNGNGNKDIRLGIGFVNRDNSINVVLDAIPFDGRLYVCDRVAKVLRKAA